MRVVFDSNIYISAFIFPGSNAEKAISRIMHGKDRLLISKAIVDEVLIVLARKFSRDREAVSQTSIHLAELADIVTATSKIRILKDEADNRILECAVAGKAEVIVTGDKAMLVLKEYKGIKIITLKKYINK